MATRDSVNISELPYIVKYNVCCDPFRYKPREMALLSLSPPDNVRRRTCIRSAMNYVHCNVSAVYHSHVCDSSCSPAVIVLTAHTDFARIFSNPPKLP